MKTFGEMAEDLEIMFFNGITKWESKLTIGSETYELDMMAVFRDDKDPRHKQKMASAKGYKNFPSGYYQVFCDDIWIGQTTRKSDFKDLLKKHIEVKFAHLKPKAG